MSKDGEYFSRRANEERKAAVDATHPGARQSHRDLAEAYERQARTLAARERRSGLHVVNEDPVDG